MADRRGVQVNVRLSEADLAQIDAAIRRTELVEDTAGRRADYLRSSALTAAEVETHERTIERIVRVHAEVMRRSRPVLAADEWRAVLDACNGTWLGDTLSVSGIPLEVADALRLSGLAGKWLGGDEARGAALVRRLAALSYAELAAVADVVCWWWGREPRHVAGPVPGEDGWEEPPPAPPTRPRPPPQP